MAELPDVDAERKALAAEIQRELMDLIKQEWNTYKVVSGLVNRFSLPQLEEIMLAFVYGVTTGVEWRNERIRRWKDAQLEKLKKT